MGNQPPITRWRWRSRMPGGKWQRCPIPMTEREAQAHAKAYEPAGVSVEMEKVPGSERQDPAPTGYEPRPSGGPSAPGWPKE